MKKTHLHTNSVKSNRNRESAGINIVMTIGTTEMLRNPEFWLQRPASSSRPRTRTN